MKSSARCLVGLMAVASLALAGCGSSGASGSGATAAGSCKPAHPISTVKKGTLTVALTNTPPYSYEKSGKMAGIDSDIIDEFAQKECLKVAFAPYTYVTAVPAVKSGRVDVAVGGFYRTKERASVVTLSAPVYLDELTVMSKAGYSTVDDLKGKRIGTVDGYLWVDDLKKLPGVETRVYPDSQALANDVKAGRLDAGLDGYGAASLSAKGTDFKLEVLKSDDRVSATNEPSQTSLLLNPKESDLAKGMDAFLGQIRDNDLVTILKNNGLPASAAEVGDSRLI